MAKHLISDLNGGFKSPEKEKSRYKPKPIDDSVFQNYIRVRERVFFKEAVAAGNMEEQERILKRMGVK